MVKEANEREVFFFGKKRKLNADGGFKVGRLRVRIIAMGSRWHADLSAYNGMVQIGAEGRSRAAALKKLEKRIDSLYGAFKKLYESHV